MSSHIPGTISASLEARLAPFPAVSRAVLNDHDGEASQEVAPRQPPRRRRLVQDLKLLMAALGAGNSVVPLGENARTARMLSEYAASLSDH